MKILLALGSDPAAASLAAAITALGWCVVDDPAGEDAVQVAEAGGADAAMVDGDRAGSGALIERLRSAAPDLALMALCQTPTLPTMERLFGAGADDVLSRPVQPAEVLLRARAIARRRHGHARDLLRFGRLAVLPGSHAEADGRRIALTRSEFAVLERLALRAGRVLDREALLSALDRGADEPGAKTIDTFLTRIRRAFVAAGLPFSTIETVWGHGWRLPTPSDAAAPPRPRPLAAECRA